MLLRRAIIVLVTLSACDGSCFPSSGDFSCGTELGIGETCSNEGLFVYCTDGTECCYTSTSSVRTCAYHDRCRDGVVGEECSRDRDCSWDLDCEDGSCVCDAYCGRDESACFSDHDACDYTCCDDTYETCEDGWCEYDPNACWDDWDCYEDEDCIDGACVDAPAGDGDADSDADSDTDFEIFDAGDADADRDSDTDAERIDADVDTERERPDADTETDADTYDSDISEDADADSESDLFVCGEDTCTKDEEVCLAFLSRDPDCPSSAECTTFVHDMCDGIDPCGCVSAIHIDVWFPCDDGTDRGFGLDDEACGCEEERPGEVTIGCVGGL